MKTIYSIICLHYSISIESNRDTRKIVSKSHSARIYYGDYM